MAEGGGWGCGCKEMCAEELDELDDDDEYDYEEDEDPYLVIECMLASREAKKDLVCFW
ncbi:hypothetical protein [Nocardia sp. NPDC059228]|uniref:hypothetical protein n=1 Tax=Nocardia sp. NPDC059228 TaxID=3346777 RepID=UPI0036BBC9D5